MSLKINSTECIGLSGESGSGKSRLLRAIADLDAHQGDINLDGMNMRDVRAHEWRSRVALVPAETYWWMDTVAEHFTEWPGKHIERLGFEQDVGGWYIHQLSSGEKQRLGLLRALQSQPEVLLLDEPTANLDRKNTRLFENFVHDYLNLHPACAIWVSHDEGQLKRISQRRFEIQAGHLVELSIESC